MRIILAFLVVHVACCAQVTLQRDTIWRSSLPDARRINAVRAYHDTVVLITTTTHDHTDSVQYWMLLSSNRGQTFDSVRLPRLPVHVQHPSVGTEFFTLDIGAEKVVHITRRNGLHSIKTDTLHLDSIGRGHMRISSQIYVTPTMRGSYHLILQSHPLAWYREGWLHRDTGQTWTGFNPPRLPMGPPEEVAFGFDYRNERRIYARAESEDRDPLYKKVYGYSDDGGLTYTECGDLEDIGGFGLWEPNAGFRPKWIDGRSVDIAMYNIADGSSRDLQIAEAIRSSLIPDQDTTHSRIGLAWNWQSLGTARAMGIACHFELPDVLALQITVDTLVDTRWTRRYAVVKSTNRGATWSWIREPSLDADRREIVDMVIDPHNGDLYYSYRQEDKASNTSYAWGAVRVPGHKPLNVLAEHAPLAEVFPNPTSGVVTIGYGADMGLPTATVLTSVGEHVDVRSRVVYREGACDLDCSGLAAGVYFVRVVGARRTITARFVVR